MMKVFALLLVLAGCGSSRRWQPLVSGEGRIERANGPALYWRALGNGADTAVVVHGGVGLHHAYLLDPLSEVSAGRTLIFFDLRGRGRSDAVGDSTLLTAENDVADVEAVRDHFKLSHLELIGHHWGAAVAARYTARHPERVTRLLLLSPFPVHYSLFFEVSAARGDSLEFVRGLSAVRGMASVDSVAALCPKHWSLFFAPLHTDNGTPYSQMGPGMCDAPAAALARSDWVRRQIQRSIGQWAWRQELSGVGVPTLVVEGAGKVEVEAAARRWAEHLPAARFLMLPGPALFPWVGEPKRFRQVVETFLRGGWPAGSAQPPRWTPG